MVAQGAVAVHALRVLPGGGYESHQPHREGEVLRGCGSQAVGGGDGEGEGPLTGRDPGQRGGAVPIVGEGDALGQAGLPGPGGDAQSGRRKAAGRDGEGVVGPDAERGAVRAGDAGSAPGRRLGRPDGALGTRTRAGRPALVESPWATDRHPVQRRGQGDRADRRTAGSGQHGLGWAAVGGQRAEVWGDVDRVGGPEEPARRAGGVICQVVTDAPRRWRRGTENRRRRRGNAAVVRRTVVRVGGNDGGPRE